MADHASAPVVNSDSKSVNDSSSKPTESGGSTGLPGLPGLPKLPHLPDVPSLPPKPVFGGSKFGVVNKDGNSDTLVKKDNSPSSSAGGEVNGNTEKVTDDKKDDTDFAKPVTPVSEANGGHELPSTSSATLEASAAPLPLTEEKPADKPGPSEPTAASIPTATAPSADPVTSTAPATNGSSDEPSSSLATGLPAKPVESAETVEPVAADPVVGDKRKADGVATDDKPADAAPAASSLFGGDSAAKPLAASVESVTDVEDAASAPKKQKTDTGAEKAAAVDAAPKSTPAAPPVEVPAPSPVTVAAPAAEPIAAPVGAPASVAPALEVHLGPAPSAEEVASTSTDTPAEASAPSSGAGVKKSNSRAKREKKPLPPVGKTARKTRSQGPAA
ncbi:hypothetical protein Sste5346_007843 [Sporothrix stenoceras]|uniref:Uncharacterized protein n=1 Tax=Sporothrix stenoceras TaxID=5173 RepID=A0ABR3YRN8_9PEZI